MKLLKVVTWSALSVISMIWLLLLSPFLESWRLNVVTSHLSERTGYTTEIVDSVQVHLFPTLHITANTVIIREPTSELSLVELPRASLEVDPRELLLGRLEFKRISAEGLTVSLVTNENGQTTWKSDVESVQGPKDLLLDYQVSEYLISRDIEFRDFSLRIENAQTGFEFTGSIDELQITQTGKTGYSTAKGRGTINGLRFLMDGEYAPRSGKTNISFGEIHARLDAALLPQDERGYEGKLEIDIAAIDDIFDFLKLDTAMQGKGVLSSRFRRSEGDFHMSELDARIDFKSGSWVTLDGEIKDLLDMRGFDLALASQLENADFKDVFSLGQDTLNLSSISSEIQGSSRNLELTNVEVEINSKERGVERFGPFSVGNITRHNDNTLHLNGLDWNFSSDRGTDVSIHGEVQDLLALDRYEFVGKGTVSVAEIFESTFDVSVPDIGFADFSISVLDSDGTPALDHLSIDLDKALGWDFAVDASVKNLTAFDSVDIEVEFKSDELLVFKEVLGIGSAVDGPFEMNAEVARYGNDLRANVNSVIGVSNLSADLIGSLQQAIPTVTGSVVSTALDLEETQRFIAEVIDAYVSQSGDRQLDTQPLQVTSGEDRLEIPGQPVVQPLVIDRELGGVGAIDIHLNATVDRLVGVPGIRSLESDIVVKHGLVNISPVRLQIGEHSADVGVEIDLIQSPDKARVAGSISNWTLNDLTKLVGLDVVAHGNVSTSFDLSGQYKSLSAFLASAQGQMNLRVKNGRLESSLLKLAGHGVLPWLFSQELAEGASPLTCLYAPLRFEGGTLALRNTTLETETTQVVLGGHIDLKSDSVHVRGEPRPLGMPFEPSPYPFQVSGPISNPEFVLVQKVPRVGVKRLKLINRRSCVPDKAQVRGR